MAVHSPADGHLTLNSAVTIHIQVVVQTCIFLSLGRIFLCLFSERERPGHVVLIDICSKKLPARLPMPLLSFAFLPACVRVPVPPHPHRCLARLILFI